MNGFRYATSGVGAFLAMMVMACADTPRPRDATNGSPDAGPTTVPTVTLDRGPAVALPELHPWTHQVLDSASRGEPVVLMSVRTATQEGFDRIVFEFAGSRVPGFHISYIDRPVRQCASGAAVPLAGDGWLQVRLVPAYGHTEAGQPTIPDRNQDAALENVKQLAQTCDFEADVTWVAGVLSPNDYRVMRLDMPARLVVDVRHR